MTSAYAYLRVSGRSQIEGEGFPRQLDAVRRYAKANDMRLAKIFREEGVSGKHELANRPVLSQLVLSAPAVVLIERLDRLARDLMVQETILSDLKRREFTLISVQEPDLLSGDPSRTLVRQMLGAVAEYERAMLVARLTAAKNRIRERDGRCEGRKPYGHRPGEAETIEVMRELYDTQGYGYDGVAKALNQAGTMTRKGTPWFASSVRRILLRSHEQKEQTHVLQKDLPQKAQSPRR